MYSKHLILNNVLKDFIIIMNLVIYFCVVHTKEDILYPYRQILNGKKCYILNI